MTGFLDTDSGRIAYEARHRPRRTHRQLYARPSRRRSTNHGHRRQGLPAGDLRLSDADRDRALSELSEAFQTGRITADEFDQRSGQVLGARTGKELTAPLADLPLERAPAARTTDVERAHRVLAPRITIGAAAGAIAFAAAVAVAVAVNHGPSLQRRELVREMMARHGPSIPVPPATGFDWVGTITPGAIAVLLVVLIIFLRVTSEWIGHPLVRSGRCQR